MPSDDPIADFAGRYQLSALRFEFEDSYIRLDSGGLFHPIKDVRDRWLLSSEWTRRGDDCYFWFLYELVDGTFAELRGTLRVFREPDL